MQTHYHLGIELVNGVSGLICPLNFPQFRRKLRIVYGTSTDVLFHQSIADVPVDVEENIWVIRCDVTLNDQVFVCTYLV